MDEATREAARAAVVQELFSPDAATIESVMDVAWRRWGSYSHLNVRRDTVELRTQDLLKGLREHLDSDGYDHPSAYNALAQKLCAALNNSDEN